ncbi:phage tail tape measure protein [Aurantimonas sp. VKM B-3413]|uniref:phage tail tape measure protein n=1 Tax=Aurantimonas sp. VKM B-3413 TaxID=2779401 RepID=UPI001E49B668|nr:phage tail tape measure protein [Aurantimonas sp. VKM B-3413]MCB8836094.1 phage tail tape measure protein [Aurantimonas sp. VKM B-3413]
MNEDETLTVAVAADTSGLERALDDITKRANSFGSALTSAFSGAIVGGRSFESVLRQLGQRISAIALDAALKPLTGLASSAIGPLFSGLGDAVSGAIGAPTVTPFAKGGVVAAPSYFPTGGKLGLMGEAGAEAILPLKRGTDGSLGVAAPAAHAGPSIVFNVSTPDAPSFQRAEAQIQAMLARAAGRGRRGL